MIDLKKLSDLIDAGYTQSELIAELHYSKYIITNAAKKLNKTIKSSRNFVDIDLLRSEITNGMSFSQFGNKYGYAVGVVSRNASKYGILPHGNNHLPKNLPDLELHILYQNGTSINELSKRYKSPPETIKRHIRKIDRNIKFRTHGEAIRPAVLNDVNELSKLYDIFKSCRKIAKKLGVKANTVTDAMNRLSISMIYDIQWPTIDYQKLYDLYITQSMGIKAIAIKLCYPYSVILRQLRKHGFIIARPGGKQRLSKFCELNNANWLYEQYELNNKSANEISLEIKAPLATVIYNLKKHKIKLRSESEYLNLLENKRHGQKYVYNNIHCDSQLELKFLRSLTTTANIYRCDKLSYAGSWCFVDYNIDGQYVEVKSSSKFATNAVDRRNTVKQYMICKRNNIDLKFWVNGYVNLELNDDDIYYAVNWKLFFDTSDECCDWLFSYKFRPPQYPLCERWDATVKINYCLIGNELNANYNNCEPGKLMKHFFPHYWSSTHINYLPVTAVFESGNKSVLKYVLSKLWLEKDEINIYGLLKYIEKFVKDFSVVSLFKPWIAKHIYAKYLPTGGIVVDPCCGWGGRFMGSIDSDNIKYIGYDLNQLTIDSHNNLRSFLGDRVIIEPEFICGDSSVVDFKPGDILFTSPPYDNTELYYGIDSSITKTTPILQNIFRHDFKYIILNLPKWAVDQCMTTANMFGYSYVETMEMKTASFIGREKTYEPILVFKR